VQQRAGRFGGDGGKYSHGSGHHENGAFKKGRTRGGPRGEDRAEGGAAQNFITFHTRGPVVDSAPFCGRLRTPSEGSTS